jgi:hypothetical protein
LEYFVRYIIIQLITWGIRRGAEGSDTGTKMTFGWVYGTFCGVDGVCHILPKIIKNWTNKELAEDQALRGKLVENLRLCHTRDTPETKRIFSIKIRQTSIFSRD